MPTVIDSISIEIESNSGGAASGIEKLAESLGKLKKSGSVGTAVKNLKELSNALKSMTSAASNANKISALADSMAKLKDVGSTGSGVKKMAESLASLKDVTKDLDDETIREFAERVDLVAQKLSPLSTQMATIKAGFSAINTKARSAGSGVKSFGDRLDKSAINTTMFIKIVEAAANALNKVIHKFQEFMQDASEWEGISARFGRGFGSQAQETYEWIQKLNQEMGINTQQFMQYSSTYATMLKGFGVAEEDASKMALGYMEMTYDIWAGYNDQYKTLEDAAEAVRSAIAGEVEPVRKIGATIIESVLEQTAANKGLEISLENATEAQKSYLRYQTMVDQAYAQDLIGTYAKEMNTAEGVMRTFTQQAKSLAQAFGSLFLPILVKVMPYLQATVELMRDAVYGIAEYFGISIQKVDFSGYNSGVTDAVEGTEALTQATKEAKKQMMGIDELTVLQDNKDSESDAGTGFTSFDVNSVWNEGIFANIQSQVGELKEKLKGVLAVALSIGTAFAAWKISVSLASGVVTLSSAFGTLKKAIGTIAGSGLWQGIASKIGGTIAGIGLQFNVAGGGVSGFIAVLKGLAVAAGPALAIFVVIASTLKVLRERWDDIKETLADTFEQLGISERIEGLKEKLDGLAEKLGWVDGFWQGLKDTIGAFADVIGGTVVTVVGGVLVGVFNALITVADGLIQAFTGVVDFFTGIFTLDIDRAVKGLEEIFSGFITGILGGIIEFVTGTIGGIVNLGKTLFGGLFDWGSEKNSTTWGGIGQHIDTSNITFANGGFPTTGEMFIARENGIPEMVGRMGSRTAVANNYQIVEGVASGVEAANEDLISAFFAVGQQIVQAINNKDTNTYIDTRKITAAQTQRSRAYGV